MYKIFIIVALIIIFFYFKKYITIRGKINLKEGFIDNKINNDKVYIFCDYEYDNDYEDIINVLNNLINNKKRNIKNEKNFIEDIDVNNIYIKKLVNDFIDYLNYKKTNKTKTKDGWANQVEKLGIPGNLFLNPCLEKLKLVKIDYIEKSYIDDYIRLSIYLKVGKNKLNKIMLLSLDLVCNKDNFDNLGIINKVNFFLDNFKVIGFKEIL